jgi:hypothetical protein
MNVKKLFFILLMLFVAFLVFPEQGEDASAPADGGVRAEESAPEGESAGAGEPQWWVWPIILFVFTFFLGIISVVAGVGGGVLFVPIVGSTLFPFDLDFVRGTALIVALTGALSASSSLLKKRLTSMRLALPMALIGALFAVFGANVGAALPNYIVKTALGISIMAISGLIMSSKRVDYPEVKSSDIVAQTLGITGIYWEPTLDKEVEWKVHRTPLGMLLFVVIGFMAGMFGLGAGWANVPVYNLLLGAPLKISVATSVFTLSITDTAAAWVYLNKGAVLPLITVPSVVGIMLGTRIGTRVLSVARPQMIKWIVVVFLFFAGIRQLMEGIGSW